MVPHTILAKEPWFCLIDGASIRFPNGWPIMVVQFQLMGACQSMVETMTWDANSRAVLAFVAVWIADRFASAIYDCWFVN